MRSIKQIISIFLTLAMGMCMVTIPVFAEETAKTENVVTDSTILTEPFDVTNEEDVDAGLYPYDEKTVLVKLPQKNATLDIGGIASTEYLFKAKDGYWYTAYLADGTTPKMAIDALRNRSEILLAEYNFLYTAGATTLCDGEGVSADVNGNGKVKDQWHLDSCGFQKAWKKLKNDKKNPGGDSGVIVAVIDTGVDFDHEDLKNNMWTNAGEVPGDGIDNDKNGYIDDYYGVNIVAKKGNGDDDHGHGTHVAGIIAAANNNVGIVGLAYNTKIMAIKAGQASGYFLNTDVCKAIDYARENGADVINMSFGSSATTIAVQDALEEAFTNSVLVAAAGNDGAPNEGDYAIPSYPAAYSFVLGVMSVDDHGVESAFTNFDAYGFNSVEYELYAPGNAITSTIPNDKYATWNGTSMAAPVVSAMAAILRSAYSDPEAYPTKFIYGQLSSTSERHAECFDPEAHGKHNLPQIANLYDALTKIPNPNVSVSDFTTFDSPDIHAGNNGDSTLDVGEVIALGFSLRNSWGMSEDTIVTIDALSSADIPNPYVEFSADKTTYGASASINYKSIGTYSTQDCGKVIEDDLWVAWENPFYLKIAKDAPNNTILKINVNIACKNGLDKADTNTYSSNASINLVVKNGVILPQIIDKDMTLTKDNYYIIPNATVIEEGVTVTVTEGTNIQFWTNDATDAYADRYMAYLVVKGTFNCIGTEEEPVRIFPSDLMDRYAVDIYEEGNGTVTYKHTTITNFLSENIKRKSHSGAVAFTKAENCEFNQNYKDQIRYRDLYDGQVRETYSFGNIIGKKAVNCAFYKLGSDYQSFPFVLNVDCEGCIFVDSFIDFHSVRIYTDCVFYGNNNYWDSETKGDTSIMYLHKMDSFSTLKKVVRDENTGTSYIIVQGPHSTSNMQRSEHEKFLHLVNRIAEYLGGSLCMIETAEELAFLRNSGISGALGAVYENGNFVWLNGERVGDFITENLFFSDVEGFWFEGSSFSTKEDSSGNGYFIIEIPGEVYVEELTFNEEKIVIEDMEAYPLMPTVSPLSAQEQSLLYFSSNEAIATVDENGLVTPVSPGTATVYVFSADMQVSASVEIEVPGEVPEFSDEIDHIHTFSTDITMPTAEADGKIVNTCECNETTETILPRLTPRNIFTSADYETAYNEYEKKGLHTHVWNSAILNRMTDDDVTKWLRITAPEGSGKYQFGGNYWGTTNKVLINHQITDYNDFISLGDINEGEFLTEAPENTFPFVTQAYLLDADGNMQSVISGGKVKFVVKFNRDMDTSHGVHVYFGSAYPYADHEISGDFVDARTWEGEANIRSVIANGYQFIRVTDGRTAKDENGVQLKLYDDWARFVFEIDTTIAMAMMMQGYADNDGIHLEWMQDDYETLAGYNVYRADEEDGNYVRLNQTIIPSDENTFTDTDIEPGKKYYYTFTVVHTDVSSESKPAGKITVTAKDTMAPSVYHSPVYTATEGNKVIISATVSDNIGVQNAKLCYRVKGSDEWKTAEMTKTNDKYTAAVPAAFVTLLGVEYYIAAFDGENYTYAGSHTSENPYEITVYQGVENNAKGDVDGDGNITVLDALKLLRAIYDETLLSQEEFLRADINGDGSLAAVEALRILQYANKTISSVLW